MFVRDLDGNEFPAQITTVTDYELNGNQILSAQFIPSKVNRKFIDDIAEMWQIIAEDIDYKIVYAKRKGAGELLTVEVKAVPLFFDDFNRQRIYERYDQHMTAMACFTLIFGGSGYGFVLVDSFDAIQWEGLGDGDTRLAMFKAALNRYGAEFRISGNTVYLEKQVGRDTSFMYRHKLNASNIVQEIDANEYYTYAKGYGDYPDGEEQSAALIREYTSPLAPILGKREAPPLKNGNITTTVTMDAYLKKLVDESLRVSVTADIHDLRRQGYALAQPELGDRVFVIDERIGFESEVRVVSMSITKDWRGNVRDIRLTFGSEGLTKRHQSNLNTAAKDLTDILNGNKKVPFSILPAAQQAAMRRLEEAQTELIFGNAENGVQGIIAQDKNDPNKLMWLNSNGWMISDDGGQSAKVAATADGLVAETIIGQSIIGVNLSSVDESGYFHVNGSNAEFFDTNTNRSVTLSPSGLYGYNADGAVRFQADRLLVTSAALGTSNSNVYLAPDANNEARIVDVNSIPSDGVAENYSYRPIRAQGLRFGPGYNGYIGIDAGRELRITSSGFTQDDGSVVYRNLRAAVIYGSGFSTNSTNAYIGSDDETRFVNKGYVDGSSNNPIYRNVRGYKGFFDGIGNNAGNNLYLGVNSEVYVTSLGMTNNNPIVWRPLRAEGFKGDYLEINPSTNSTHIYARPSSDGSLKVTRTGTTDSFRPVEASAFDQSSSYTYKTDITGMNRSGRDVVDSLQVQEFYFNWDYEKSNPQIGLIAEWSEQVASEDFKSINTSKLLMYVLKNTQENNHEIRNTIYNSEIIVSEIDGMKAEITNLKAELNELKGKS